jgi:hypothetical protein
MNKSSSQIDRIKIGLTIVLLTALTGCAGFGGGGYYGNVVVPEPDQFLFGGDYDRGPDVHNYSHRGAQSRGAVRSGGSHGAAHSGGGGRR